MGNSINNTYIQFIGTGGIYDYDIGNSSAIINTQYGNVLIDCGYTVFGTLMKSGSIDKVDYMLVTHLHGDHVGSIHPLALYFTNKQQKKLKLLYPDNTFLSDLKILLKTFLGVVENYIEFVDLAELPEIGFLDTSGLHVGYLRSYSYWFNLKNQFIFFSGDIGDARFTHTFLETISHENILVFHETSFITGNVHVFYKDLEKEFGKYKVYAYHCDHRLKPKDCNLSLVAEHKEYMLPIAHL